MPTLPPSFRSLVCVCRNLGRALGVSSNAHPVTLTNLGVTWFLQIAELFAGPRFLTAHLRPPEFASSEGGVTSFLLRASKIFGLSGRARWRWQEFGEEPGAKIGFAFSRFRLGFRFGCSGVPARTGMLRHTSCRSLLGESGRLDGIISHAHFQAWATLRAREKVGKFPLFFVTDLSAVPSASNPLNTCILRLLLQVFRSVGCYGICVTTAASVAPFFQRGCAG